MEGIGEFWGDMWFSDGMEGDQSLLTEYKGRTKEN